MSTVRKTDVERPVAAAYEEDFFAWTEAQAAALAARDWNALDIVNLIEEIETLGRSERREIENRLSVLLLHLLKWQFQPQRRSNSWKATIVEQRKKLLGALKDSPSLKSYPETVLFDEYDTARLKASGETNLPIDRFPIECPFSMEEIRDDGFYPEAPADV